MAVEELHIGILAVVLEHHAGWILATVFNVSLDDGVDVDGIVFLELLVRHRRHTPSIVSIPQGLKRGFCGFLVLKEGFQRKRHSVFQVHDEGNELFRSAVFEIACQFTPPRCSSGIFAFLAHIDGRLRSREGDRHRRHGDGNRVGGR